MEDPNINAPPADALDQELIALLQLIALQRVSPAIMARALELQYALETSGRLKPGRAR